MLFSNMLQKDPMLPIAPPSFMKHLPSILPNSNSNDSSRDGSNDNENYKQESDSNLTFYNQTGKYQQHASENSRVIESKKSKFQLLSKKNNGTITERINFTKISNTSSSKN